MEYDIKIKEFGDKFYYKKGTEILHREDGPAIEFSDGSNFWYINGKLHRTDGPAVEFKNPDRIQWWVDGKYLSPAKQAILNKIFNNRNEK